STLVVYSLFCTFLFNDTAPTERYTLSLHDALPIFAEHLEELMVACCIANVFEVIVFAARTYATLRRRGAGIRPRFRAREDILELHHAGIGEEQRGIIARHERGRGNDLVPLRFEKGKKLLAYLGGLHCSSMLGACGTPDYTHQPTQR